MTLSYNFKKIKNKENKNENNTISNEFDYVEYVFGFAGPGSIRIILYYRCEWGHIYNERRSDENSGQSGGHYQGAVY
jgi:hypothetical protein